MWEVDFGGGATNIYTEEAYRGLVAAGLLGGTTARRLVTGDMIRAEAQRRIIALTGASDLQSCLIKQLNAQMRATELVNKRAFGVALTTDEENEAVSLQALADGIKSIRARSNELEADPPADYTDNSHWAAA
ncbi:hypothetical protein [Hyphomicrobium sp. DMF-1]|uniref:hypothetical protein n=1 Tax=Hyphomicrobium sp. DMF-1 TaxID=3019544 RepID=UPI0022EBF046|nr:hypothetical protein [Hyphomicrobium sp. DMF-1]WBT40171.1 hypothetical protein PE058_09895 [Hyphomicrobium sp. DMF-1]